MYVSRAARSTWRRRTARIICVSARGDLLEYASIVCLPNRVVVEVVSDDEPALDGMSG